MDVLIFVAIIVLITAVAHSACVGINMIGARWYRAMMAFFGVVLIYFGTTFLVSALWVL